jgi:hypothetical protein
MNDPHVERLHYQLRPGEGLSFNSPPPLDVNNTAFRLRLDNGLLAVEMNEHHATEAEAKKCVEPWLRAWEIETNLRLGKGMIRFEFQRSEIIDRNPPPPGEPRVITASGAISCGATVSARGHVVHAQYPPPPMRFRATPDVETMWNRYLGYLDGKEPLLSMAYLCLTVLEGSTRAKKTKVRKAVCTMYNIDHPVRKKLGDIVSERGSSEEARKLGSGATRTPLTEKEKQWVEEVIKALIRRKAEYDADSSAPLPLITMGAFINL